ncbi:MAG TPA: arginase [Gemmatimonadota bacterium]|jgi:arginase|nr:arginase [Gemmatimonadota bacterium]
MPRPYPETIHLIGVPLDLGAGRRGVDMGPSAIRIAGVRERLERLGYKVIDTGDVPVPIPETADPGDPKAHYLPQIAEVATDLADRVTGAMRAGAVPLVLGGDHSLSIGSIAGAARWAAENDLELGLLWFDAHADMNTPDTTPSGNIHGMPLATSLGYGPPELTGIAGFSPKVRWDKTVLIGARDVDRGERALIHEAGIRTFTMREIDEDGIVPVLEEALAIVNEGTAGFLVSWDMDFVDPNFAPGVGTAVKGGVDYREGHLALEIVSDTDGMIAMDLVETNPILDEHNRTGRLGMELILSAFGKTIL